MQSNIKPYVGVRLSSNKIKMKSSDTGVYKRNDGTIFNALEKEKM
ncbi:hypothetical protein INT80_12825 [Gallibacterium anatis]|uniref:Porin opacity type domain-containing protein n=1 Tax=Gallibacterium anatis TaxID=750 RepID=A0A930Y485_9PAST|nr:hypothetical protein [Gallibacterium anatis]